MPVQGATRHPRDLLHEPNQTPTAPKRGAFVRMLSVPLLGGVRGVFMCQRMRKDEKGLSMNRSSQIRMTNVECRKEIRIPNIEKLRVKRVPFRH